MIAINSASPITNISSVGFSCGVGSRKEKKLFYKYCEAKNNCILLPSHPPSTDTHIHTHTQLSEFLIRIFSTIVLFLLVQDHPDNIFYRTVGQEFGSVMSSDKLHVFSDHIKLLHKVYI